MITVYDKLCYYYNLTTGKELSDGNSGWTLRDDGDGVVYAIGDSAPSAETLNAIPDQTVADYLKNKRQNGKLLKLKAVENSFYDLCFQIFGDYEKRGFDELETRLLQLLTVDHDTAILLSVRLLAIDSNGKREGGLQWWDDAERHV